MKAEGGDLKPEWGGSVAGDGDATAALKSHTQVSAFEKFHLGLNEGIFEEAGALVAGARELPTALSHAELSRLDASVRRRAIFSARLGLLDPLQQLKRDLELMASGKSDEHGRLRSMPEARVRFRRALREAGYRAPEGKEGTLFDHTSHARMTLIIETNLLDKMNQARWMSEQSRMALFVTPAWELIRMRRPAGAPRDWVRRWMDARATLDDPESATNPNETGGRMVALKSSPIWQALGDGAGGYRDTLGNPWPPFAFRSGMSTRGVRRRDVYELGILRRGQRVEAAAAPVEMVQVSAARFDEDLRRAAETEGFVLEDGMLRGRIDEDAEDLAAATGAALAEAGRLFARVTNPGRGGRVKGAEGSRGGAEGAEERSGRIGRIGRIEGVLP